jgi:hypothetical protein|tara:strand:- start:3550 stop:3726 length:177 start_codon:yes stop_codon:yes gene_type:complete
MTFRAVTDIIVKDLIWDIDSLPRNTVDDFPMDYATYILFEKEIHKQKIKAINKRYLDL